MTNYQPVAFVPPEYVEAMQQWQAALMELDDLDLIRVNQGGWYKA